MYLVIERHDLTVFSNKCDVMENIHPDETKYTLHLEKSVKKIVAETEISFVKCVTFRRGIFGTRWLPAPFIKPLD